VFDLGGAQYAIEHSIVEAFAGQIDTGVDFGSFIEPIAPALAFLRSDHHRELALAGDLAR
jgi:hypothetical protein